MHCFIIENKSPKGFAENHNFAFSQPILPKDRRYFIVLNPDVRIYTDVITPLVERLQADLNLGVLTPQAQSMDGILEDNARRLPTLGQLFIRILGHRERWPTATGRLFQPDWISGMFMVFHTDIFKGVVALMKDISFIMKMLIFAVGYG